MHTEREGSAGRAEHPGRASSEETDRSAIDADVPSAGRPLRIALFSGNYNYLRDGANQALNRLVGHLLKRGAQVRVYSPTTETPAFAPAGELVSVPSVAIPGGRGEYRFATHLPRQVRDDVRRFDPDLIHVSCPDMVGHEACDLARDLEIPVVASMHTRFETYPRYYGLGFMEGAITRVLRRFYRKCDAVAAPSASAGAILQRQAMNDNVRIWARGIDRGVFHPGARDAGHRSSLGLKADDVAIGFVGRLVMEKGLDVFSETISILRSREVAHRIVVVGDGPARGWFEEQLPEARFTGHLTGTVLGKAVASLDVLFNPSVTETFGNVTLEAMAAGIPVVAARASGSESLVTHGQSGLLAEPGDLTAFADALQHLCQDDAARRGLAAGSLETALGYDWDAVNEQMVSIYLREIDVHRSGARARQADSSG